jgi:hypothetical protein
MSINTKLIWEKENSLPINVCKESIEKFEIDPDKIPDVIVVDERFIKKTTSLNISPLDMWKKIDSLVFDSFNDSLKEYAARLSKMGYSLPLYETYDIKDSGYVIEKYDIPNKDGIQSIYSWHNDFSVSKIGTGVLTFMIFLNDVNEGGEIEFIDGTKLKPKAGKMTIFPSTWEMIYRINSPISNPSYICKGYLCVKYKEEKENEVQD